MMNTNRNEASTQPRRQKASRQGWKPVRDAIIAFAVFPLLAMTAGSGQILAGPTSATTTYYGAASQVHNALAQEDPAPVVQIATVAASDENAAIYRRTSFSAGWILLGASFALIMALNLAVARHLRHAYVPRLRHPAPIAGNGGKSEINH